MNFNGYGLFNDIRDDDLRTYNRINVFLNIRDRHGPVVSHGYLRKFSRMDQISIFKMMSQIRIVGFEQFRRNFLRTRNA